MSQTEVRVEMDGETYFGRVEVLRGMVTVNAASGSKTAPIGASPVESLARILLREIIQAELKSKRSP
jgi:hypothetical protein